MPSHFKKPSTYFIKAMYLQKKLFDIYKTKLMAEPY